MYWQVATVITCCAETVLASVVCLDVCVFPFGPCFVTVVKAFPGIGGTWVEVGS